MIFSTCFFLELFYPTNVILSFAIGVHLLCSLYYSISRNSMLFCSFCKQAAITAQICFLCLMPDFIHNYPYRKWINQTTLTYMLKNCASFVNIDCTLIVSRQLFFVDWIWLMWLLYQFNSFLHRILREHFHLLDSF